MRKLMLCVALLTAALALVSCRPYGASSPFNRPLPSNPKLLPGSPGIVDRLDGWGPVQQLMVGQADTDGDYFHPVYAARRSDPVYTVHCLRWTSSCEVEGHRVRIPAAARARAAAATATWPWSSPTAGSTTSGRSGTGRPAAARSS